MHQAFIVYLLSELFWIDVKVWISQNDSLGADWKWTGYYLWFCHASRGDDILSCFCDCVYNWQWISVFLRCKVLKSWHWERSRKTFVVFARNCKPHIVNSDLRASSVVAVGLRLLYGLSNVVMQKLDKLVTDITLVVLNPCKNYYFQRNLPCFSITFSISDTNWGFCSAETRPCWWDADLFWVLYLADCVAWPDYILN